MALLDVFGDHFVRDMTNTVMRYLRFYLLVYIYNNSDIGNIILRASEGSSLLAKKIIKEKKRKLDKRKKENLRL